MKNVIFIITLFSVCYFISFGQEKNDSIKKSEIIISIGTSIGIKYGTVFAVYTPTFQYAKDNFYKNAVSEQAFLPLWLEFKYKTTEHIYKIGVSMAHQKYIYFYEENNNELFISSEFNSFIFQKHFTNKIKPFLGGKLLYSHKNFFIDTNPVEPGAMGTRNNIAANLFALQIPAGFALNSKHFFYELQANLFLVAYINGNYVIESYLVPGKNNLPITLYDIGNFYKYLFVDDFIRDGYFLNTISFKIGYKFPLKQKTI